MKVILPTPLAEYTRHAREVQGEGGTLEQLLADLDRRYPGIRFRMVDEQDQLRKHMRFFVNGEIVKDLAYPIKPGDEVGIVQALSGG